MRPSRTEGSKGATPRARALRRLHVVVPVDQHRRLPRRAAPLSDDHRVPRGRMDGRLQSRGAHRLRDPLRGARGIRIVLRAALTLGNAQELEQLVHRARLVGGDRYRDRSRWSWSCRALLVAGARGPVRCRHPPRATGYQLPASASRAIRPSTRAASTGAARRAAACAASSIRSPRAASAKNGARRRALEWKSSPSSSTSSRSSPGRATSGNRARGRTGCGARSGSRRRRTWPRPVALPALTVCAREVKGDLRRILVTVGADVHPPLAAASTRDAAVPPPRGPTRMPSRSDPSAAGWADRNERVQVHDQCEHDGEDPPRAQPAPPSLAPRMRGHEHGGRDRRARASWPPRACAARCRRRRRASERDDGEGAARPGLFASRGVRSARDTASPSSRRGSARRALPAHRRGRARSSAEPRAVPSPCWS